MKQKRFLVLEDGSVFEGVAFGAEKETIGEVVFTTSMTGYQEAITDQSFNGQILTFTYPMVGNYGVNRDDYESIHPTCKGVIVKENARVASNWRSQMTIDEFLKKQDIPGIAGIDTRALTRKLRTAGVMRGCLINEGTSVEETLETIKTVELPINQVEQVSTKTAYPSPGIGRNVVVVDFGLKHSILRELSRRDCQLTVVPYDTPAEKILEMDPDGVMLTNGPGDPVDVPCVLDMIRGIQGKLPIFGICLGHQLFSLANGAKTTKLKFGHRGLNHPVKNLITGDIGFTSQNHGYVVDEKSLKDTDLEVTHIEINDGTIEGVRHKKYPAFSVQFHPDAAPGPHDQIDLFDKFMDMMDEFNERK